MKRYRAKTPLRMKDGNICETGTEVNLDEDIAKILLSKGKISEIKENKTKSNKEKKDATN